MSVRSRRPDESLGSSWGDADYATDEASSVQSDNDPTSEVEWEDSDKEVAHQRQPHVAPLPCTRTKRTNLFQSTPPPGTRSVPPRKSANKTTARQLHSPETSRTRTRATKRQHRTGTEEPAQPTFITPTINDSSTRNMNEYQPRDSRQVRYRSENQPAQRRQIGAPATAQQVPRGNRQARHARGHNQEREVEELGPWYYVNWALRRFLFPFLEEVFKIFAYAMHHFIRPILGVVLGIGIIIFGLQTATGVLRSSLKNALLAPICSLPASTFFIPACREEAPHANFEDLIAVQNQFDDIVEASKDVHTLPAAIKNSELAIRDLRTLVKFSRLPSRNELDNEFENFILTAKEASQDLARYNARIGGATDRIIATNKWTMNVLRGIDEDSSSTGAVGNAINALTRSFSTPAQSLQARIYDQYVQHISRNKDEIDTLILSAGSLLWVLTNLDERLTTIYGIAVGDDNTITAKNDELLSSLWTKLGGNRADKTANAKSLNLLKNIYAYRKKAVIHVSETLVKLQEIQAELENLREGVAAPALVGDVEGGGGMPIEYHVDLISRGVERLQATRGEQFRMEAQSYLSVMRGGEWKSEEGPRELEGPHVTAKAN
ncbi:hypothetical protein NX059_009560 [Plenodomus lindquistii]|nr:hypothetical protein NX059_009560 [Plenodomus lindquistii]